MSADRLTNGSSMNDHLEATKSQRYFLGLFTVESWREFKRNGGQMMGFNLNKARAAAELKAGDRILCYLTKVSAFVGVMEVTAPSYLDSAPIWSDGVFPVRLPVLIVIEVPLTAAVPIRSLSQTLSFMKDQGHGTGWTIHVRTSPRLWKATDGIAVIRALEKNALQSIQSDDGAGLQSAKIVAKPFKSLNFSSSTRVGKIIQKSQALFDAEKKTAIGSYDQAVSFNKVTGYSVNVPISTTCKPTATCLKTCYFAVGAPSWSNSLRHQSKVYTSIVENPEAFAERISLEYDRLGLTFLRWNGGGDLFAESVSAINYLGRIRPDIILWVVTRIPEFAAQIDQSKNIYIHFSLDRHSLSRREQFLRLMPRSQNYFFSYQCEPGEMPDPNKLGHSSILFFDNYTPTGNLEKYPTEIVCPLNGKTDIAGICVNCRRCFDGNAVSYGNKSRQVT